MVIEEPRPKKRLTIISWVIIVICVIVFLFILDPKSGLELSQNAADSWGFVTDNFQNGRSLYTLVSSAFLHGDWFHLIGNMYFLYHSG